MPAKDICRIGRGFLWWMEQAHMRLLHLAPALAMVAGGASRYKIDPYMLPAHVARDDVVDRQMPVASAAILAGIIIAAEDLAAR